MKNKLNITIIICLVIILFGAFVWPTIYKYEKVSPSEGVTYPIRINRLTGKTDIFLLDKGWTPNESRTGIKEKVLPAEEMAKVTGKAYLGALFKWELYNGSSWQVRKAFVVIRVKEKAGTVRWERKYELHPEYGPIRSLSSGTLQCIVSDTDDMGEWEWISVETWGTKTK